MKLLQSICCTIILLVSTAEATPAPTTETYSPSRPLTIGVITPLSGEAASFGAATQNAITLALENLPPEQRAAIRVKFEDDAMDAKRTVSAFQKLQADGGVDALINISSGTSNALAPLAEQHKIPFLAIASDRQVSANRRYAFNFWVTPEEETRALLPEAARRGYKKIARIGTIHSGVSSIVDAFNQLNQGQMEVALADDYPPDVKDFRTYITKLRNIKELDAVLVVLLPGQLSTFAQQARNAGVTQPFFGYEIFEDLGEIKNAQGALQGAWYANASDPSGSFLKSYAERFPDASLFAAGNSHDAIALLASAATNARSRDEIRDYLATVKNFSGAMGTYSTSGDQRFTFRAVVKEVTVDGFRAIG